jgi:hypothetical protein
LDTAFSRWPIHDGHPERRHARETLINLMAPRAA